jgi:hypothetical protein
MRSGHQRVKAPAKKIAKANSQSQINQSQHTQIRIDLTASTAFARGFGAASIGANRRHPISRVKRSDREVTTE